MKVLYVDHPEADLGSSFLFLGLSQELGADNVVDWPRKGSFHGETDRYPSPYLDPALNGPEGETGPFWWMPPQSGRRRWCEDEVVAAIGSFDLVVLASTRKYNDRDLTRLLGRVGRAAVQRLVVVCGEDYPDLPIEHARRFRPAVVFKRELLVTAPRAIDGVSVEPLPFSSPWDVLPCSRPPAATPRDVDVAFLGGANYPGGKPPLEAAIRRAASIVHTASRPFEEYAATLARSKIAVATRGYGYDTQRICDIASCEGTLLALEAQPVVRHYPFIDGEHCLLFGSPDELESKLLEYLTDEPRRARVAAAGYAHLRAHHTCRARARQFLEAVSRCAL